MTRDEHLAWAKTRALEYVDAGDPVNALTSLTSDLSKHPGTAQHQGLELQGLLMLGGHLTRPAEVREWIEGFQ